MWRKNKLQIWESGGKARRSEGKALGWPLDLYSQVSATTAGWQESVGQRWYPVKILLSMGIELGPWHRRAGRVTHTGTSMGPRFYFKLLPNGAQQEEPIIFN